MRDSTKRQYEVYLKKWRIFCASRNVDPHQADVNQVLEFLSHLFHAKEASYSAINTARSALNSCVTLWKDSYTMASHPTISRFMKGVFNLRPPRSRYTETWDAGKVLNHLRKRYPANKLSLKELTQKLVMLLALTSAQRVQTLYSINIEKMSVTDSEVRCVIEKTLKQSKQGCGSFSVCVSAYPLDRRLCVVKYLREYLRRTTPLRESETALFICYQKPHKRASTQTISRWLRETLQAAGIDTGRYKSHSTRAVATSTARRMDVPLSDILAQAGWARETTFQKFYHKPTESKGHAFTKAVLNTK